MGSLTLCHSVLDVVHCVEESLWELCCAFVDILLTRASELT